MIETYDVVVIGGGQAGLSVSHELARRNIAHVVIEQGRVGQGWRDRWDSFCLVLPNWTVRLAGQRYAGDDPDGYMVRDEIVNYLLDYARSFAAPVREGVSVRSLERAPDANFVLRTSSGDVQAREVVVATGGYQKPYRPRAVAELTDSVRVIDAGHYRNPESVPAGRILVIGSGQTGCQIAEELHVAGRDVVLACGRTPWLPRRIAGRDIMTWLVETQFMTTTLAELPSPLARLAAGPQTTGAAGGRDLNYRTLAARGVTLVGHMLGVQDRRVHFADDVAESVAFADARVGEFYDVVCRCAADKGLPIPERPVSAPFVTSSPTEIKLSDIDLAIVACGYRPDYSSWMRFPDAFDHMGFPIQEQGSSQVVPGLHFMGVHFQRNRSSATLFGVGEDAEVLVRRMAGTSPRRSAVSTRGARADKGAG